MAPPKRYWVKLKVPSRILSTLPEFPTPISKSRLKKLVAEERRAGTQSSLSLERSSPQPNDNNNNGNNPSNLSQLGSGQAISSFKINSGLKESSTSGLTMNSISSGLYALDKSGKPARKWVKKPTQFKTFSGFKVKYISYRHKDGDERKAHDKDNDSKKKKDLDVNKDKPNTVIATGAVASPDPVADTTPESNIEVV